MFDGTVAVNIAYIIGNSPLRISAVGWDDRPATEAELANMLRGGRKNGRLTLRRPKQQRVGARISHPGL